MPHMHKQRATVKLRIMTDRQPNGFSQSFGFMPRSGTWAADSPYARRNAACCCRASALSPKKASTTSGR